MVAALLLGFVAFANMIHKNGPRAVERADAIVVLTGGQNRILEAVKLLAKGRANRMLISGVNKQTSKTALARLTPKYTRLFKCCVDVGYRARDTIGNAVEIADWARTNKYSSLIVVTASYHMPRSIGELKRAAPDVRLISFPVVSNSFKTETWWSNPGTAKLLAFEYAKFIGTMGRLAYARITVKSVHPSSAIANTSPSFGF